MTDINQGVFNRPIVAALKSQLQSPPLVGGVIEFLLAVFDTNFLILSTISVASSVYGTILIIRRSHLGTFGFAVNDIAGILLWIMAFHAIDSSNAVMVVQPLMLLINDSYGVIEWRKLLKEQEAEEI